MSNVIRNHFDPCHYEANGKMTYFHLKKEIFLLFTHFSALTQPALETYKLAHLLVRRIE
jgi:hypothetical protein